MSNPTPTTQAVEQLRDVLINILVGYGTDLVVSGGSIDKHLDEGMAALADTIKIVGEEIIENEVTVNPHLGTVNPQEAQNRLRVAQRQRLELVVEEMKCK